MLASLDSDFLKPTDTSLEVDQEQESTDSSDEEVDCTFIVSNNIQTWKPCLKCALDDTFSVAYYDSNVNSVKHF